MAVYVVGVALGLVLIAVAFRLPRHQPEQGNPEREPDQWDRLDDEDKAYLGWWAKTGI